MVPGILEWAVSLNASPLHSHCINSILVRCAGGWSDALLAGLVLTVKAINMAAYQVTNWLVYPLGNIVAIITQETNSFLS